jgi:hypothetical protein
MRRVHPFVVLAAATVLCACGRDASFGPATPSVDKASAASGPSASGHGNWFNAAGEYVSRSFHARETEPGIVTGSWVYHFTSPTGDKRVNKGTVTCLRILSPTDAIVSGRVNETENPALLGQTQIFRVHDAGEGSDDVDRMSALFARTPESGVDCTNFTPLNVTPIESGNIQVKP